MNQYELLLILDPEFETEKVSIIEELSSSLDGLGGKLREEDFWGMRDLAYPIGSNESALYSILDISVDARDVGVFRRKLEVMDKILRFMFIKKE